MINSYKRQTIYTKKSSWC